MYLLEHLELGVCGTVLLWTVSARTSPRTSARRLQSSLLFPELICPCGICILLNPVKALPELIQDPGDMRATQR